MNGYDIWNLGFHLVLVKETEAGLAESGLTEAGLAEAGLAEAGLALHGQPACAITGSAAWQYSGCVVTKDVGRDYWNKYNTQKCRSTGMVQEKGCTSTCSWTLITMEVD